MKLIDLLVQELPKRGGWPEKATKARQDADGEVCFEPHSAVYDFYPDVMSSDSAQWLEDNERSTSDLYVTREQYELALQKTIWDGLGLPPVGVEIEVDSPRLGWTKVTVTAVTDNWLVAQYGDGAEFAWTHRTGTEADGWNYDYNRFRKLRTEAERQRERTIEDLQKSLKESGYGLPGNAAEILLEAIAQGKVSGIKLTD